MNFPQLALAQVEVAHPDEYALTVAFPSYAVLSGIRVRMSADGAGAKAGEFELPSRGSWGIVGFYQDNARSGVWLRTLPDNLWNAIPREILAADPRARVSYGHRGEQDIRHGNGDRELVFPDGTVLRFTTSKDGSMSNGGGRERETPKAIGEAQAPGVRKEKREDDPRQGAPVDLALKHTSGLRLYITADGMLRVKTPKGHLLRLHDATEKVRDADYPHPVIATPEEDAFRVESEIELKSEVGHQFLHHDDPELKQNVFSRWRSSGGHEIYMRDLVKAQAQLRITSAEGHELLFWDAPLQHHVKLMTKGGHELLMRDSPVEEARVELKSKNGAKLVMHDHSGAVTLSHPSGAFIEMKADGTVTLKTAGAVKLDAPSVTLGSGPGAQPVARIGDFVVDGVITSGSAKVSAT